MFSAVTCASGGNLNEVSAAASKCERYTGMVRDVRCKNHDRSDEDDTEDIDWYAELPQ